VVRLLHNDRTDLTTTSAKTLAEMSQTDFLGEWVEAEETVRFGANGSISITIKRIKDNKTLLSYNNESIDTWRTGSSGLRPKWGIYRSVGENGEWRNILRDEILLFADFSIEKVSADGIESLTYMPSQGRSDTGSVYSLDGRRIASSKLTKGIYIKEGKKIVIK